MRILLGNLYQLAIKDRLVTVKFDYKAKTTQMGSPIFRRILHVSLGFTAFVCLVLSLTIGARHKPKRGRCLPLS